MVLRNVLTCLMFCTVIQANAATIKVACIGDSITQGAGSSGGQTYPVQLQALIGTGYQIMNYGVSGRTMLGPGFGDFPYVNEPNYSASSTYQPNIVVIMLGTNDSKPQNWANKVQFEADATALVTHYATLASKPQVYLCLPCPVYNAGAFGITSPIVQNEIIPILRSVAAKTSTPLIDVNSALSGHPEWFPDNVHPNNAGYAALAQAVMSAITLGAPANLSASVVSASRVDLAWTDGATTESGFSIERAVNGGAFQVLGTAAANATSFSDTNVQVLTEYSYRVRAVNAAGQSPFSNEASAATPDVSPAAPSEVSAVVVSTSQIDLTWKDNADNEAGYKIERQAGADGAFAQVGTALENATAFSDAGLVAATLYTYRVRATNNFGDSAYSNVISLTTFSGGLVPTGDDNDGDGFSNALETLMGTSPTDVKSTPLGNAMALTSQAFANAKLGIKLNFTIGGKDSVTLSGALVLPAGFSSAGQTLVVDIGGVAQSFALKDKGTAKSAAASVSVKDTGKGARVAKLSVKVPKGDFGALLADEGFENVTVSKPVVVRVSVLFANALYGGSVELSYKAKAGKSGAAK